MTTVKAPPDHVPPVELRRLTSLRALSAVWVFVYHFGFDLHLSIAKRLFADGYAGVAFFFVLSGFVLAWSTQPKDSARRFFRRRLARIYPSYLVASLVTQLVVPVGAASVAANLAMLQSWFTLTTSRASIVTFGLNPPSWSLSCEAAFYALLPLLLWASRRVSTRIFVFACVACAIAEMIATVVLLRTLPFEHAIEVTYFTPVVRVGEFVLGVGLGVAVRRGWRPRVPFWLASVVTLAAIAVVRWLDVRLPRADPMLLLFFGLVVVAAAGADLSGRRGLLTRRPLVYAGRVSYCFYIIQFPVLAEIHRHVSSPIAACAVAAVATPIAAILLHHLVEVPGQNLLRPRGGRYHAEARG